MTRYREAESDEGESLGLHVCVHETERAILVKKKPKDDKWGALGKDKNPFDDMPKGKVAEAKLWVPKSQIHETSDVHGPGDEGDLIVTRWFATQAGL